MAAGSLQAAEADESPLESYFRATGAVDEASEPPSSLWSSRGAFGNGTSEDSDSDHAGARVRFSDSGRGTASAGGGGDVVVLATEAGEAIQRETRLLGSWTDGAPVLEFDLGFGTNESWAPGAFSDSFTIGVQTAQGEQVFVLTADASGFTWAPAFPDGLSLDEADIVRELVPFGAPGESLAQASAYHARVELPASWSGEEVSVWFELFDNGNDIRSVAYFSNLKLVPEPRAAALLALGGAALFFIRRK